MVLVRVAVIILEQMDFDPHLYSSLVSPSGSFVPFYRGEFCSFLLADHLGSGFPGLHFGVPIPWSSLEQSCRIKRKAVELFTTLFPWALGILGIVLDIYAILLRYAHSSVL